MVEATWAWVSLWAQAAGGAAAKPAAGGPPPSFVDQFLTSPALPFLAIGVLAYFLFIRPESRRRAEFQRLLGNLKKNDRVITAGGIYGTIVNINKDSEDVTLKIDDSNNVRIRVLRSAISRVVAAEGGEESSSASGGGSAN
jgi:preprotein translocase subunit YajC